MDLADVNGARAGGISVHVPHGGRLPNRNCPTSDCGGAGQSRATRALTGLTAEHSDAPGDESDTLPKS